jgi:lipoprotein-releasing system ATP-binding protein
MEAGAVEPVVRAVGLRKGFGPGAARIEVLRDVALEVAAGELVAVAGSSGSGKSTLLHVLGGLMHPDAGSVVIGGESLYAVSEARRARVRNAQVGFVFQFHHLLPEFTAVENVALPALVAGRRRAAALERGAELLGAMGLGDRLQHKPGELSGGEQQRVAVARALVNSPRVVFADEPSGNLDLESANALHTLLENLSRDQGVALVVATHSPSLAERAHRALVLRDGNLHGLREVEAWA